MSVRKFSKLITLFFILTSSFALAEKQSVFPELKKVKLNDELLLLKKIDFTPLNSVEGKAKVTFKTDKGMFMEMTDPVDPKNRMLPYYDYRHMAFLPLNVECLLKNNFCIGNDVTSYNVSGMNNHLITIVFGKIVGFYYRYDESGNYRYFDDGSKVKIKVNEDLFNYIIKVEEYGTNNTLYLNADSASTEIKTSFLPDDFLCSSFYAGCLGSELAGRKGELHEYSTYKNQLINYVPITDDHVEGTFTGLNVELSTLWDFWIDVNDYGKTEALKNLKIPKNQNGYKVVLTTSEDSQSVTKYVIDMYSLYFSPEVVKKSKRGANTKRLKVGDRVLFTEIEKFMDGEHPSTRDVHFTGVIEQLYQNISGAGLYAFEYELGAKVRISDDKFKFIDARFIDKIKK